MLTYLAIKKLRFFHLPNLSSNSLFLIFLIKVACAWLYLFIHYKFYYGGDVYDFLNSGHKLFDLAFKDKSAYFRLNFLPNSEKAPQDLKPISDTLGYYRNASSYFMIRVSAALNWLTFKFNTVNALLFQLLSFTGLLAIYKSFHFFYPKDKTKLIIGIFFIPSVVFWLSGYHKEGISIFALGISIYAFVKNKFIERDYFIIVVACISILILFVVRNYLALLFCLALVAFYAATKLKFKSYVSYLLTYAGAFLIVNLIALFSDRFSYLNRIYEKHYFFKNYAQGNSDISIPNFKPELSSFISNIPNAFYNALCRPHFFDVENTHLLFRGMAALENFMLLVLIIAAFVFPKDKKERKSDFLNFNFFLSISFLILLGLVISNLGAMVRYKSVVYPFFITSLLLCIDFKSIWCKK